MKKILFLVVIIASVAMQTNAQKRKTKDSQSKQIIILKDGGKDTKLTIETKDGETLINGKPASEFKDDNVSVITNGNDVNVYAPGSSMELFDKLKWNGNNKALLGVTTEKEDKGVKITNVQEGSAADKAGLKEGDIITKVEDEKITDPGELSKAITAHKPKDEVKIYYERDGKSKNAKATLGETSGAYAFAYNTPAFKMNRDLFKDYQKNFDKGFSYNLKTPMPVMPHLNGMSYFSGFGKGRLGINIEDADNDGGATVTNVDEGSVAEKAGLKKDDVITEVDGKKVKDVKEVLQQVRESGKKNNYSLKAKRNGSEMNFDIKIPKPKANADL